MCLDSTVIASAGNALTNALERLERAEAELVELRAMRARAVVGQSVKTGNPALDAAAQMMARVILLGEAS